MTEPTFAYGLCVGNDAKYQAYAARGLAAHAPGTLVFERRGQSSIFDAYNSILDEAQQHPGLAGVVLLHEDTELRQSVDAVLNQEFADPLVAIVGAIGGRGVKSVRWSQCAETFGRAPDAYNGDNDRGGGAHDVDMVDGLFLALSSRAVRELRFDSRTFTGFHAYDADICMQARAAGLRVRVAPIDLFHHTKGGFGDVAAHRRSDDLFRRKWGIPLDPPWQRLRRRVRNQPH